MKKAVVVGSGSIAKRHIRNLRNLYPNAEVVCVSSSGRKICALQVGATSVLNTIDEVVNFKPDIAIVASPASLHLLHAEQLLKADIPVLIEKPLCVDFAEISSVFLSHIKPKVAVGYNLRFLPAAKVVKQVIASGRLGRILTVFSEVGQYLPDWRPENDYRKGVSAQKKLGGGALLELSHELDYLNWIFGRFDEVLAKMGNSNLLEIDVEDTVDALLTNAAGTIFHLHLDFLQRTPSRFFKAIGEEGTITWNLLANEVLLYTSGAVPDVILSDADYDRNNMYLDQLRAFVAFSKGEAEFESSISSGIEVIKLVEAIRLSNKDKTWARVDSIK